MALELGTAIDVPLGHEDPAFVRSHFDAVEIRITDAPCGDEVVGLTDAFGRSYTCHVAGSNFPRDENRVIPGLLLPKAPRPLDVAFRLQCRRAGR